MKKLSTLFQYLPNYFINKAKALIDSIQNNKIRAIVLNALPFWVGSFITGLVAVGYAKLFALAEKLGEFILSSTNFLFFIIIPVCFILSWWIVQRFAPYARGSGIPQVLASLELTTVKNRDKISSLLSIRIIIVKILSSLVMAIGGGVIGREGPTIQISGSIFRVINNVLPDWWPKISRKNMILAGAAAGLAAAFNTPLGGVVFAVEELSKTHINNFKTAIFISVILSGLTAQMIMGSYLYLGYPAIGSVSLSVILAIILVAAVAGWAGSLHCKILIRIIRWLRGESKAKKILFIICCGLLLASMSVFNKWIPGSGKNLINHLLFSDDKYCTWYLPLFKMLGSMISFSFGAAGGVFAPSLSMGAGIGGFFSGIFHYTSTDANILILSGMVAFLTGVTRSPFTCAILVLEMTGGHNVIFQLMLSGIIAAGIAYSVEKISFYEQLKEIYLHDIEHESSEKLVAITEKV